MTQLTVETPIGEIHLLEKENHLWIAALGAHRSHYGHLFDEASKTPSALLIKAHKELKEYFTGQRFTFSLPLAVQLERWEMGTPFEQRAWQTLVKIGFGRTISYKEQALWMGHPKAIRAVGRANGKNPLAIFVPCHRVIGAQGSLTGYGGGLEIKAFLLEHEARSVNSSQRLGQEHHFAVLK